MTSLDEQDLVLFVDDYYSGSRDKVHLDSVFNGIHGALARETELGESELGHFWSVMQMGSASALDLTL